jgi:hypothetical protein
MRYIILIELGLATSLQYNHPSVIPVRSNPNPLYLNQDLGWSMKQRKRRIEGEVRRRRRRRRRRRNVPAEVVHIYVF